MTNSSFSLSPLDIDVISIDFRLLFLIIKTNHLTLHTLILLPTIKRYYSLQDKYTKTLLNVLYQVLTVDPQKRKLLLKP